MSFLRNVLHDLVEKRLWPVAVALLVALVAVPVVLGRGSKSAADTGSTDLAAVPASPSAPGAVPADKVVRLATATSDAPIHRDGKLLNPFVQHHQPKPVPATSASTGSGASAGTTGGGAAQPGGGSIPALVSIGGGSGSPGGSTPSTTPVTPTPPQDPNASAKDTFTVSLKFGEDGAMKTYKDIKRLTPLPSADNPFFVFLGVSDDQKSAVFLVSSDAVPTGDGTCKPTPSDCSEIAMQKRDLEYFELQSGTAGVVQYQLEITGIGKAKAKNVATAAKLRARESRAGRDYLRQVMADDPGRLAGWSFDHELGLLVHHPTVTASSASAHVPVAIARAAVGEAPEGTATVMTVPVAPGQ